MNPFTAANAQKLVHEFLRRQGATILLIQAMRSAAQAGKFSLTYDMTPFGELRAAVERYYMDLGFHIDRFGPETNFHW